MYHNKEAGPLNESKKNEEIKKNIALTIKRWLFYEDAHNDCDPIREKKSKQRYEKRAQEVKAKLDKLLKYHPEYAYLIEEIKAKRKQPLESPYKPEDFQPQLKQKKHKEDDDDPRPKCKICGKHHWPTEEHDYEP